jgi:hypothetical protein
MVMVPLLQLHNFFLSWFQFSVVVLLYLLGKLLHLIDSLLLLFPRGNIGGKYHYSSFTMGPNPPEFLGGTFNIWYCLSV